MLLSEEEQSVESIKGHTFDEGYKFFSLESFYSTGINMCMCKSVFFYGFSSAVAGTVGCSICFKLCSRESIRFVISSTVKRVKW